MTAMTPRDALEVVRDIRTLSDAACSYNGFMAADDDEISNLRNRLGDFDEALAVLSELVERAGEPVAYISQIALDALNKCRNDDHNGIVDVWMRPNDTLKATIPLYTAPGASHER